MHPDMMREVVRQRGAEQREAARKDGLARALRRAIRAQRSRTEAPDALVVPAIPDYVDGAFGVAGDQVPAQRAGAGR